MTICMRLALIPSEWAGSALGRELGCLVGEESECFGEEKGSWWERRVSMMGGQSEWLVCGGECLGQESECLGVVVREASECLGEGDWVLGWGRVSAMKLGSGCLVVLLQEGNKVLFTFIYTSWGWRVSPCAHPPNRAPLLRAAPGPFDVPANATLALLKRRMCRLFSGLFWPHMIVSVGLSVEV